MPKSLQTALGQIKAHITTAHRPSSVPDKVTLGEVLNMTWMGPRHRVASQPHEWPQVVDYRAVATRAHNT